MVFFLESPARRQKYTCAPGNQGPRGARAFESMALLTRLLLSSRAQAIFAACLIASLRWKTPSCSAALWAPSSSGAAKTEAGKRMSCPSTCWIGEKPCLLINWFLAKHASIKVISISS
jgi:hypothetical protein